jgi:hypothetical protein
MPTADWSAATDVLIVIVECHKRAWASLKSAVALHNDAISVEQYILQVSIQVMSWAPFSCVTLLRNHVHLIASWC